MDRQIPGLDWRIMNYVIWNNQLFIHKAASRIIFLNYDVVMPRSKGSIASNANKQKEGIFEKI